MFASEIEPVRSTGAGGFRNVAAQGNRQSSDERNAGRNDASRDTDRQDVDLEKVAVLGYN